MTGIFGKAGLDEFHLSSVQRTLQHVDAQTTVLQDLLHDGGLGHVKHGSDRLFWQGSLGMHLKCLWPVSWAGAFCRDVEDILALHADAVQTCLREQILTNGAVLPSMIASSN